MKQEDEKINESIKNLVEKNFPDSEKPYKIRRVRRQDQIKYEVDLKLPIEYIKLQIEFEK